MSVYKLHYEDGFFYFGSTKSPLMQRFYEHTRHSKLYPDLKRYSKPIVSIELIEECGVENLLEREDFYIRPNIDNPLCLNEVHAVRSRDDINKYMREVFYLNHRDEILERQRKQYADNREELLEKHQCDKCGGKYTTKNKHNHLKTQKHKSAVK